MWRQLYRGTGNGGRGRGERVGMFSRLIPSSVTRNGYTIATGCVFFCVCVCVCIPECECV